MGMGKVSLDLNDKKILFELDKNSRKSFAEIGKATRLSKQTVKFRVERLLRRGVIDSFHTMWNVSTLGYSQHNIYFRFRKTSPEKEAELTEKLENSKHVSWLAKIDGHYDLIAATHFKAIQEFYTFLQGIIYEYGDIIQERDIMTITNLYQFKRYYLIDKKPEKVELAYWVKPRERMEIDSINKEILAALVENAREPATKIAKKVGITPEAVNNRIKSMLKKELIQSFLLKLNWQIFGYSYYKIIIDFKQLTGKRKQELVEFCAIHPNVSYVIEGIGIGDIQIDLELESQEALHNFLSLLRETFSDIISDYETLSIFEEIKMRYQLPDEKNIT